MKTGKYKELQRLDIKRAIRFLLENYSLQDRFVTASAFASGASQQAALERGQRVTEIFQTVHSCIFDPERWGAGKSVTWQVSTPKFASKQSVCRFFSCATRCAYICNAQNISKRLKIT